VGFALVVPPGAGPEAPCEEKSGQTRARVFLLAWVTPWLPSWNSGVTLVRGAPLRMPPKKHNLANLGARGAAKPLLPSTLQRRKNMPQLRRIRLLM